MLNDTEVLETLKSMRDLLILQRNCLDLKQGKTELERDTVRTMSRECFALYKAISALEENKRLKAKIQEYRECWRPIIPANYEG